MNTGNRWEHVLTQICPDYGNLTMKLEEGPTIVANLKSTGNSVDVTIREDWDITASEQQYLYYSSDTRYLDNRVDWATEQLDTWPGVCRTSYNTWSFRKLRDAEKFVTMFNIIWPQ